MTQPVARIGFQAPGREGKRRTVSGMTPLEIHAGMTSGRGFDEELDTIAEAIQALGGWENLFEAWREIGGEVGCFADVWELSSYLFAEEEMLAERFGVEIDALRGFASAVQVWAVTGRMEEAQDALATFCSDLAGAYEEVSAQFPDDEDARELGKWWRVSADGFAARAPRVAVTQI